MDVNAQAVGPGLHHVSFTYFRRPPVVSDFSLTIRAGRTLLLGPNGAGKSTLLLLLAGARRPRTGRLTLGEAVASPRDLRRTVALMPQTVRPLTGLTIAEQVTYAAWLAGHPIRQAERRMRDALASTGLEDLASVPAHRVSGGELRRVGLAQVLASGATTTLLDEPTAGLDPEQRKSFRDILEGLPRSGAMVVSSHDVNDIASLFDWVSIIDAGQMRFDGPLPEFLAHGRPGARRAETAYLKVLGRAA